MKVKMKKFIALLSVASVTIGMMAGCASKTEESDSQTTDTLTESDASDSTESSTEEAASTDLSGVEISFLNSKGEIQSALEEVATRFEAETGIKVDVIACGAGEVPYTKITSSYNSGTAPTMAMLDTTDIVALAEEYALDLSDEKWIAECESQVTKVNDKVYSFPFCIEGRGLIYNKTAIEKTLGTDFDPTTINSYDALKSLLETLRTKGMENPVVISKEDWSLGAHQLGFIYDTYDGTTAGSTELINKLKSGELNPADYERFNEFVDTMDLLLEYNINGKDPLGALYEQDPIFLADGEAAIWANGCWAWPNIEDSGASTTDEYGFLPFVLGNDTTDFANTSIQAAPSKQVMIDNVQATPEQQEAAKAFLNWIVYSESGQQMLVETCALIPACSNNSYEPLDPLGRDIKTKMASGNTYNSSFIAPSDHWSVMGAAMQKYIAKQSTKEELTKSLADYWTSQK
ncbi:carbohydrate ABC transporter substrate-binding protein (CUT1 family) [Lachnotalea glycerini]|uniref:Carbohydrate ABC transporter substrate-binding protein n=1 Tax=Lachnotalea glycerini TaxID=1763509 RepID=A0A255IE95_9FIRM|nr:ABC transporter substrate-binding protein [Lachnotalea glycerini]PXV91536.1 carbohydrate ABC transporter substrate-binding protein (CUT1 family) [Lachnotalea glycerini]RDY29986.1 carbohydrate ABC transporter substrate-binding protein [Lachnotalea glycerini]